MGELEKNTNRRGARSVQRILGVAAKMFGKQGFQKASMTAVARAAKVSKGLLHYHFDSKEHLLLETQRAAFQRIRDQFMQRSQRGDRGLATALDGIDALWDNLKQMRHWTPFMVETMALGLRHPTVRPMVDDFIEESTGWLHEATTDIFLEELDQLTVPPDRLAKVVRLIMLGSIVELAWADETDDLTELDQIAADLKLLFSKAALSSQPGGGPDDSP